MFREEDIRRVQEQLHQEARQRREPGEHLKVPPAKIYYCPREPNLRLALPEGTAYEVVAWTRSLTRAYGEEFKLWTASDLRDAIKRYMTSANPLKPDNLIASLNALGSKLTIDDMIKLFKFAGQKSTALQKWMSSGSLARLGAIFDKTPTSFFSKYRSQTPIHVYKIQWTKPHELVPDDYDDMKFIVCRNGHYTELVAWSEIMRQWDAARWDVAIKLDVEHLKENPPFIITRLSASQLKSMNLHIRY